MKLSQQGLNAIKAHEGLRLKAYPDPGTGGEPWTIGYGHTIGVTPGDEITEAQAAEFLRTDVEWAEQAVNAQVRAPLSQEQFDALVSLVFNIGDGAFSTSTLVRKLNTLDYAGAAQEFVRWNRAGGRAMDGLTKRRLAERAMFIAATPPHAAPVPEQSPSGPPVAPAGHPDTMPAGEAPDWKPEIKPMAPILAGIGKAIIFDALPSIISAIPRLGAIFTGPNASEVAKRNTAAVSVIAETIGAAVGASNAQATVEALKDPAKLQQARDAIDQRWGDILDLTEAGSGGIDGARKADAAIRASTDMLHSPSFWIALALLPLVYMIVANLIGLLGTSTWSDDARAGLAGTIVGSIIGGLVGYYFGQTTSRNRSPARTAVSPP